MPMIEITPQLAFWLAFAAMVGGALALDLGVFHRKTHVVSVREALIWSAVWVALALVFNAAIWHWRGEQAGMEFLTGYLIEKSLSLDNIFVFVLIFSAFAVPAELQHRVLFWGVLGAIALRAVMIGAGAALVAEFHWILYIFGAFLVLTGIKMLFAGEGHSDPAQNPLVRWVKRHIPVTDRYHGERFLIRLEDGRRMATPLLLALVTVEAADVIFAVDSIPAIFAVTTDPFIVFTSNIFAIMGLRSLYFALAGIVPRFVYLKHGLSLVLVVIGAKMLANAWAGEKVVPTEWALGVTFLLVGGSIVLSLLRTRPQAKAGDSLSPAPSAAEEK